MELEVAETDEIILPESALIRSFVGLQGRVKGVFDTDAGDDVIVANLRDKVVIRAEDGEVNDLKIVNKEELETGERRVIAQWNGALSLPHPQLWDVDQIEFEAEEVIEVEDGTVETVEYGYSRPAHEYASDGWRQVAEDSVFGSDEPTVAEQWVHRQLLVVVGLVELEGKGDDPVYAVVQLAPPVPSPYELARYWAYAKRNVAETDLRRYMLCIDGAFEEGRKDPVATALQMYGFHGSEIEQPDITGAALEENEDVNKEPMASLPNRPLTREEVDTVVESYESISDGRCHLLLPDDPMFVDDIVRRAQHVTEGDHVSFTITTPEKYVVFELEDRERGLRWYRKQGSLEE